MKEMDLIVKSPKGNAGYTFIQKYKDDNWYIYEQVKMPENRIDGYQLFKRKINTQFNCETWPGGEQFGVWAWQLRTFKEAMDKLNERTN